MWPLLSAGRDVAAVASVVRLSREGGLLLGREFCARSLVVLRQWGQDPQAISDVYWALRQCDAMAEGGQGAADRGVRPVDGGAEPPVSFWG